MDSLLSTITYANGGTVKAKYDLAGNLISETDPEGSKTSYTFDEVGRITAVTDALGNTTSYTYDAADNLTKVTDALGHITAYTYDRNGNLTSETDALGNVTKYTYTPEGWLETVTDGEGNVTKYTYDKTGNVLTADCGDRHEENSYNELGKLTTVTTSEGVTEYQYDERGYLISVTEPNGNTVSYTYDEHGNRMSMTYPDGKKAVYTYDAMNRLISVKGADGKKTTYTYDLLGQRISTDGEKEDTAYTYDEVGNLISQVTKGKYNVSLNYTYDLSGRMISESRTENGTAIESSYIYDALGQLTEFTRSDGITESYTYDPAGNMLSKIAGGIKTNYTYNAGNQLVGDGTYKYTYDKIGNLVEKAGNGGQVSYTYNALNLLEKWTDGENVETYTYNAAGLLSTVNTNSSTTSLTWDILYGEGVVISANENGEVTDYTYGLERISASTKNSRTEYVYDGRGSVIGEVTKAGLLSTAKVTTKSYTPFGEQIGEATSGFGWNGEYFNATTGQVYLRARFYEPEMNRFAQKDSLRGSITNPQSLNRYAYCGNDPVNFIDPSGMVANWLKVAAGAVAGAVTGAVAGAVAGGVVGAVVGGIAGGIAGGVAASAATKTSAPPASNPPSTSAQTQAKKQEPTPTPTPTPHPQPTPTPSPIEGQGSKSAPNPDSPTVQSTYDRDAAVKYACEWSGNTSTSRFSISALNSIVDFLVNGPNRNADYYNYKTNCANFVSQCLVAGGIEMTDEWHQYNEFNLNKHLWDIRSAIPIIGRNYWYDWDTGSVHKTDENGNEVIVQPWSEAQAQYEYFLEDNTPIIIVNQNNPADNQVAIMDALSNNNIQAGDLMYFGEKDANGNISVHHATIITSVDENSINYAGNTNSRFDYPLIESFLSSDNKMVFVVQMP